jgi:hypothetical protein
MTGPWQPDKPDHRNPRNDVATRLWAASQGLHPRRDPLESKQLGYALAMAFGFVAGVTAGMIIAAIFLGAMQ